MNGHGGGGGGGGGGGTLSKCSKTQSLYVNINMQWHVSEL